MTTPETTPAPAARLHVLGTGRVRAGTVAPAVDAVTELAGVPAVVEEAPGDEQEFLTFAASTTDPVVILPAGAAEQPGPARPVAPLGRLLLATDRSPVERPVVAEWIVRARALGLEVEVLHVLTGPTRPLMWEGAGHHATAWLAELRQRERVDGALLTIRSGEPAAAIAAAASRVDLVVVCWNGDPSPGRARVLRRILATARRPVLLVRAGPPVAGDAPADPEAVPAGGARTHPAPPRAP